MPRILRILEYVSVTGHYISGHAPQNVYQSGVQLYNDQRNMYATRLGAHTDVVLKGPKLEIPLLW